VVDDTHDRSSQAVLEVKEEIFEIMDQILESSQYVLGPKVREFEKRIAEYTGVADAIGVASGRMPSIFRSGLSH